MSRKRVHIWTLDEGVDKDTKMAFLAPFLEYLKEDTRKQLKEAAVAVYGDPWSKELGILFDGIRGKFPEYIMPSKPEDLTVLQYFWLEAFKDMVEALLRTLEKLRPPQSKDAAAAMKACRPMSFEESTLVFCREYFGLHSFSEVRDLTISDLLLAKKDRYNTAAYERARAELMERRQKTKSK